MKIKIHKIISYIILTPSSSFSLFRRKAKNYKQAKVSEDRQKCKNATLNLEIPKGKSVL
jgi:hypothetical protein